MMLTIAVERDELIALLRAATPIRITIDAKRGRAITLGRPRSVELVPGRGIRITGDARITWDALGVAIPVRIPSFSLFLGVRIGRSGQSLALDPQIEELDMKYAPAFLDERIATAIRDAVDAKRDRLAWSFVRTLSRRIGLPAGRIEPLSGIQIAANEGALEITERELRVSLRFGARIERRVEDQVPEAAPVSQGQPVPA